MGTSDLHIKKYYKETIPKILNNMKKNSKIAWLGQKHPSMNRDNFLYNNIIHEIDPDLNLKHCFFDIENQDNDIDSFSWDVHQNWKISGFDLVLGLRVLYLCNSRKDLIKNLSQVVKLNKEVIFDFTTASLSLVNNQKIYKKKNNSNTILPFFPEFYDEKDITVVTSHDDQKITLNNFSEENLYYQNILTFKDTIKKRFYTIMRFY